eukprot:s1511_g8.t1
MLGPQISVKQFLDLLFEPTHAISAIVLKGQNDDNTTRTNDLKEYFEKHYRSGGDFYHSDYASCGGPQDSWTWMHKPTEIQVWRDAIDLTSGQGGQVFFHYTSELAFRNITHPNKEAAEIWASLRTEGPNANTSWGKGIYTVAFPPDHWHSREQVLDNSFCNIMQRDRESEDPEEGPAYVDRESPKRAAFCIPILIDLANAFDASARAIPEMEGGGKESGNLGDNFLLQVSGDGVHDANGQLLETLRQRARFAPADLDAKSRLAWVLRARDFSEEALPLAEEMVAFCDSTYGPESIEALTCQSMLAKILFDLGNFCEAEKLHRRILDARLKALGPEHEETVSSMGELALTLFNMDNCSSEIEAVELHRQVLAFQERRLGTSHPATLHTITNLATGLADMGNLGEATDLHRIALEAREKTLGPEHPDTLQSVSHLAAALHDKGGLREAVELQRRALEARERHLGPQHPRTRKSLQRLESILCDMINKRGETPGEFVESCRELLGGRAQILGLQHPDTVAAMSVLALTLTGTGRGTEAAELNRQVVEVKEKTLGIDDPATLSAVNNLASTLADMGNLCEAIDMYRKVLEVRKKRLGRFAAMQKAVIPLCYAWFFTGREDYAEHAAKLLRTWFLDPTKKMNPHLTYAQGVPGQCDGRCFGIVDSAKLPELVDAAGLLMGSTCWSSDDHEGLVQWFSEFLEWLQTSKNGREEDNTKNNHATQYDVQVVSYALFVDKPEIARQVLQRVPKRRIDSQIRPDGSQPQEVSRENSWDYSCYNLKHFAQLAHLGRHVDVDLWAYEKDGRSIKQAINYLLPYASGEGTWPHKQLATLEGFRLRDALMAAPPEHRCIEAVEVGTKQPVHVHVALQTRKDDGQLEDPKTLLFPRLLLASSEVASIRVNSEGFWPVTIQRAEPGRGTAAARWMKAVEDTRRLYVKRAAPGAGQSQLGLGGSQVWFPTFTAPDDSQVERLALPKLTSGGQFEGPLPPSASQATAAEWAAAFCCETRPPLLPGACLADFDQHGTLVERFARLLDIGELRDPKKPVRSQLPFNAVLAQKLHECVAESKLAVFPWIVFLCLQMRAFAQDTSALLPTLGVEHLLAAVSFQELRAGIGARHRPLLSQDFLAECKAHAKQRRNAEVRRAA